MDIGTSTQGVMHVTHAYDQANPSRTMQEEASRRVAGGEKTGANQDAPDQHPRNPGHNLSCITLRRSSFRHEISLILPF